MSQVFPCPKAVKSRIPMSIALVALLVAGFALTPIALAPILAAEKVDQGGTIVWAVHESTPDFDIQYESTYIAVQPIGPIYNGLVTQDVYHNGKIVGDLAERWEVSEDGNSITFFLHTGVKFHDGSDFTCADAQYSLAKLADPKRANPTFVGVLKQVYEKSSCTDDHTLVVDLKRPSAAIMTLLSGANAVMMKKGIAEAIDRSVPAPLSLNPSLQGWIFRPSATPTIGSLAYPISLATAPW